MMHKILFVTILLLNGILLSQSCSLKGVVYNSENLTLEGANVLLQNSNAGIATNSAGEFEFENILPGRYELEVTYVGYKKEILPITIIADSSVYIIKIVLASQPLSTGDVLVTSLKFERPIKDLPLPLETINAKQIETAPSITTGDALKNLPGISLQRDGIWGTNVSIRGLSRANVVTLVDGNRIETSNDLAAGLSMVDISDVQRVEVIKGASSSIYGSGALGGVVNIITDRQVFNRKFLLSGSISSGYNSVNNLVQNRVALNTGNQNWYAHLSGMIRRAEDAKTPRGVLKNSRFNDYNLSASLGLIPLQNHELNINYQQFHANDVGVPGGNPLFPANADVRYPKEERKMFSGEYKIKNLSGVLNKISFKVFHQFIMRDVENIPYTVQNVPAQNGQPARRVSVLKITPSANHFTNGAQFQSDWTLFKDNYLVTGIDVWQRHYDGEREKYQKIEVLNASSQVVNTINKVVGEQPIPDSYFLSMGVFAQDELKLHRDFVLTIGSRLDNIRVSNEKSFNPVYEITNGVRNNAPSTQILYWDKRKVSEYSYSGNVGLLYHAFENIDFTFNVAQSFRSVSLEERYQYIDLGNLVRLGNPDLKPEKGFFADAGFRIWKSVIEFRGNIFWNQLRDMVVEKPGTYEGRQALIKTNIGKARLYGFDFSLQYNAFENHSFYISGGYVNGRDIYQDAYLPQMPPLNFRAGIRSSLNYLDAELAATIFGNQNNIAAGEIKTPGYTVFDLYLSSMPINLNLVNLQVFAGFENITDKAYRNHLSTNRGLITTEPGRNIFARINVNW